MSNGILSYKGVVYPWHCDHMGHMNVMWYIGKFDEATWSLFAKLGLTNEMLAKSDRGMAAVDQHIQYKKECMPGDTLEIYSKPVDIGTKSITFIHEMINCISGEVVATSKMVAVHTDNKTRKSVEWPEAIKTTVIGLVTKKR